MRKFILIIVLLASSHTLFSQVQIRKLDSLLEILNYRELAFGSLTISQNGETLYQKAIGFSYIYNADKRIGSTLQTRYKIGSVTKMFTATMIFQLVEEGKLTLDETLSTWYPDLPNAGTITLTHLLNHQSGLHDYTKDTGFESWMNKPKSQEELLQLIREKGADFQPGEKNDYCNSNYLLLSYILEKITGKSYEVNLQDRIIRKIKLANTFLAKDVKHPEVSTSYKYANGKWNSVLETDPNIHLGAGALISTPADLTTFINALFTGKLIKQSSLEKMTTLTNDYGLGLFPYDHGSVKGYGHNGRIEEFYTAVRYFPENKISVAYCTNGINFPRVDILNSILNACFKQPVTIPFSKQKTEDLTIYTGIYAAENMPAVTLSLRDKKLVAETQGATFELEPVSKNYFMHTQTGYYFEFAPAENELQIKETDNVYFLKRK